MKSIAPLMEPIAVADAALEQLPGCVHSDDTGRGAHSVRGMMKSASPLRTTSVKARWNARLNQRVCKVKMRL